MMFEDQPAITKTVLLSILLLSFVFSLSVSYADAQTEPYYYVTVKPTTPDSPIYAPTGMNWNLSFEAIWSYGENSGHPIENATVYVEINNKKDEAINMLSLNTTTGFFSFNYSSSTTDILTFTPITLVTQNGAEYTPDLYSAENDVYGFQSRSVVIWWDTFHVSLVSYNTETLGKAKVVVNVTYLLLPEDGLTLPDWATYSHQTHLPKIVHNSTVTINGVIAEETSTKGIFTANVPIWLSTAYIHVAVSQEEWVTTHSGFSFTQSANEPFWIYGIVLGLVLIAIVVTIFLVLLRKSKDKVLLRKRAFAFMGSVLLAITSVISLYWGVVGLDSTLHGFDWLVLALLGILSFSLGLVAAVFSIKRKKQAVVIFAVLAPMVTNLVIVKSSLDLYALASPWLVLVAPFVLSLISGVLISNTDEAFS